MSNEFIFTDRYQAMGIPYPDPETMCEGPCEGVGFHPTRNKDNPKWIEAHTAPGVHKDELCDGWHFVECADCGGTGKRTQDAPANK